MNIERYGPDAVGIEPAAPLAPGEYVFRGVGEPQGGREFTWFAFGVDASPGATIASAAQALESILGSNGGDAFSHSAAIADGGYSYRNAFMASTRLARNAGI
ncbi:MAG: hypothetical protein ABSH09_08450 [Bryobacteraceae bacterium]